MGESFLNKSGGGGKINGLIKEYYVYAGEEISPGSFVDFVNGVNGSTTKTSTNTTIVGTKYHGQRNSAVLLPDGKVFIAHGGGSDVYTSSTTYLYGIVCTVNGATITPHTNVQLDTTTYTGYGMVTQLLQDGTVLIIYSSGGSRYLYGVVCKIDGTTISIGNRTQISTTSATGVGLPKRLTLLDNGDVFVPHKSGSSDLAYATIVRVKDGVITKGTHTTISSGRESGLVVSSCLLPNKKVFMGFCYSSADYPAYALCTVSDFTITVNTPVQISTSFKMSSQLITLLTHDGNVLWLCASTTNYYLYGGVFTVNGDNITVPTFTQLSTVAQSALPLYACELSSANKFLVGYNTEGNNNALNLAVATVSGTTITIGTGLRVAPSVYSTSPGVSLVPLRNDTTFVSHCYGSDEVSLHGQVFGIVSGVPSATVTVPVYETQVKRTLDNVCRGVAKTRGVGGTSKYHLDKVQVYVPNI